jgi:hypothetical protein
MTWRQSTREEIFEYYESEFPNVLEDIPAHITPDGPKQYAVAFRERHPVKQDRPDRDFIRRHPRGRDGESPPAFRDWGDLMAFFRAPAENDPLRTTEAGLADPTLLDKPAPVPDAVYYSLDHWERDWVLAVDIDAKDVALDRAKAASDSDDDEDTDNLLDQTGIREGAPAGYPYEFEDVQSAINYGLETEDLFQKRFSADDTFVLYSGQGAHVYLLDDDRHHHYDEQSREVINDLLQDKFGIPIDPVVTADRKRVMRLPYSLHSDVSRVVQPVESKDFNVRTDPLPDFVDVENGGHE